MSEPALRVLAVSPRFAPTNGADTHRLRLVVNQASSAGWSVEVLCVEPTDDVGPTDAWLAEGIPGRRPGAPRPRAPAQGVGPSRTRAAQHLAALPARQRTSGDRAVRSGLLFHHGVSGPPPGSALDTEVQHPDLYGLPGPLGERLLPPQPRRHTARWPPQVHVGRPVPPDRRAHGRSGVLGLPVGLAGVPRHLVDRSGRVRGRPWLVRPFPAEPAEMERVLDRPAARYLRSRSSSLRPRTWRYIGALAPHMLKAATVILRGLDGGSGRRPDR